jgi:hypothetical protein
MEIAPPIWNSTDMVYKFNINECSEQFIYKTLSTFTNKIVVPAGDENNLLEKLPGIMDIFILTYQKWFPGKLLDKSNLQKRLVHKWFCSSTPDLKSGCLYHYTWKPTAFMFGPQKFEINWMLSETKPIVTPGAKGVFAEMVETTTENLPLSSDTGPMNIEVRTRQEFRKKVRQARLRSALAEMRAAKLAEEYYRRYEDMLDSDDSSLTDEESENSEEDSDTSLSVESLE